MATRKKRASPARTRKPRSPARVRKRAKKTRGHHHPELWGLGLVATGLVLATFLWLGWDGGPVGSQLSDWLDDALGSAAALVPAVLLGIGGLMLVRSSLVDLRPFRTGLIVGLVGVMIALGEDHGGALGGALGGGLAQVVGGAGSLIVGTALVLAGVLLVTGASAGAFLRRTGHAVRQAGSTARRSLEGLDWTDWSSSDSSARRSCARDRPEPRNPAGERRRGIPRRRRRGPAVRRAAAPAARSGRRDDGRGRRAGLRRPTGASIASRIERCSRRALLRGATPLT